MTSDRRARFEEIYDAFSGLILAYASRRTADAQDAADIVAETFTIAWRRLDDVPAGDRARPWLYGVARRVLANHHRGNARRERLRDRLAVDADEMHDPTAEIGGPDLDRIVSALSALSDSDRELLTLVAWDELDRDEIAVVLGCSAATVRLRLHRARKRFAGQLGVAARKRTTGPGHESTTGVVPVPDMEEV